MTPDQPTPAAPDAEPQGPSNLRLRVIWGALAAVLLISCTFGGPVSFGLFFAGVQAIMLKEFYRIMRASGYQPAAWIGILVGTSVFLTTTVALLLFPAIETASSQLVFLLSFLNGLLTLWSWALVAKTAMTGALIVLVALPLLLLLRALVLWPRQQRPFESIAITLGGLFYVSLPMALLNVIAFGPSGFTPGRVFLLIFFVWSADTGAYFAGKSFGRHKLAPSISPGKTWEGWAGGAVLTLVVGWAAGYFLPDISLGHRLVAAGVVAVFGPLGDLAESMLKRSAGVKDSGTFLPGHGGLLDRFDAFLLVLPVLALLQALVS